jgi:hypothetical protein
MAELTATADIRKTVREKYAADARAAARGAYGEARALESKSGVAPKAVPAPLELPVVRLSPTARNSETRPSNTAA